MDTHSSTTKVRMTIVVDKVTHDGDYSFPADFVPPFLSAPTDLPPANPGNAGSEESSVEFEPPAASEPDEVGPESALLAAPLELCAAAPARTKKQLTFMGAIRAGWFYIFTALGGVIDYGIQRYTELPVPTGTATVIGGALYGLKRALYPDTTF